MSEYDWAYGAWLGDGYTRDYYNKNNSYLVHSGYISTHRDYVERFRSAMGWKGNIIEHNSTIKGKPIRTWTIESTAEEWRGGLDPFYSSGVCDAFTKKVPDYIYSRSDTDKWDFIQGVMDTDGHIHKKDGRCQISLVSKEAIFGISKLLESLRVHHTISYTEKGKKNGMWKVEIPRSQETPLTKYGVSSVRKSSQDMFVVPCDGKYVSAEVRKWKKGRKQYKSNDAGELLCGYAYCHDKMNMFQIDRFKEYYGELPSILEELESELKSLPYLKLTPSAKEKLYD